MLINIPKPCHEDWQAMTPTDKGAFCSSCVKEVVDFSTMTDTEVLQYLQVSAGKKICGRVSDAQLQHIAINVPEVVFVKRIAAWKKFLAVLIVCFSMFMTGCSVGGEERSVKSIFEQPRTKGEIAVDEPIIMDTISSAIVGDICVAPNYVPTVEVVEPILNKGVLMPIEEPIEPPPPPPPIVEVQVTYGMIIGEFKHDTSTNQKPKPIIKKDTAPKCDTSLITKI